MIGLHSWMGDYLFQTYLSELALRLNTSVYDEVRANNCEKHFSYI
jgi:hypothetical protein